MNQKVQRSIVIRSDRVKEMIPSAEISEASLVGPQGIGNLIPGESDPSLLAGPRTGAASFHIRNRKRRIYASQTAESEQQYRSEEETYLGKRRAEKRPDPPGGREEAKSGASREARLTSS